MLQSVRICTVSDTLRKSSSPAAVPISTGAACLVSSADRCSVSSVRACRGIVCPGTCPALVLARPVLRPVLCSPFGCAGGRRGAPAGYIAAAQPRPVSAAIKFFKEKGVFQRSPCQHPPHPHKTKRLSLCNIPNFPKK